MLTSYYSKGCDSRAMFSKYKISEAETFENHLNKYNVIHINMVNFWSESQNMDEMIEFIEEDLIDELKNEYTDVHYPKRQNLIKIIAAVFYKLRACSVSFLCGFSCIILLRTRQKYAGRLSTYKDF